MQWEKNKLRKQAIAACLTQARLHRVFVCHKPCCVREVLTTTGAKKTVGVSISRGKFHHSGWSRLVKLYSYMFIRWYSFTSLYHPQWWNFQHAELVNCDQKTVFFVPSPVRKISTFVVCSASWCSWGSEKEFEFIFTAQKRFFDLVGLTKIDVFVIDSAVPKSPKVHKIPGVLGAKSTKTADATRGQKYQKYQWSHKPGCPKRVQGVTPMVCTMSKY